MKTFIIAALLSVSLSGAARAVDLTMTYKDPETGKMLPDVLAQDAKTQKCGDLEGGPCLTLGAVIFHALLRPYDDEQGTDPLKGEEKFKRGALAYRVLDKKAVTLTPPDIAMIKTVVGKLYSPAVIFQTYRAIDPALAGEPVK